MPSDRSAPPLGESKLLRVRYGAHLPRLSRSVGRALAPLNRAFDWAYQSEFNPLYRSGTLAVALLMVLIVSGIYLLCFYSVSQPYESVTRIAGQSVGSIIRGVHRYSADLVVLAILFHVLQLTAQGKTWGPRVRAWISGVVTAGMFFLAAWSGLVLVWDIQGQLVASSGALLFTSVPFLHDTLRQAFDGSVPVGAAFFFVNLFLHAALPLGLFAGLWIHTSKLARARWFPIRPILLTSILLIILVALFVHPPVQQKADLLRSLGRLELDWWYGFWIPALRSSSPALVLGMFVLAALILFSVPWTVKPEQTAFLHPSVVDEALCTGCTQCEADCPWEAISMVPRPDGKRLLARVSEESCVSCGICAASCADECIGPVERDAAHQLASAESIIQSSQAGGLCLVVCCNNGRMVEACRDVGEGGAARTLFPVECCGTIHSRTTEKLLSHFGRLAFVGCPERNCVNRDGLVLLSERVYERRVPFLARSVDRQRILLSSFSEGESPDLKQALARFEAGKNTQSEYVRLKSRTARSIVKKACVSAALMGVVVIVGRLPYGAQPTAAIARLSLRLPAAENLGCRTLTEEERRTIPRHMQQPQVCETKPLRYRVKLHIDGALLVDHDLYDLHQRIDRPLLLSEDYELPAGEHQLVVSLAREGQQTTESVFNQTLGLQPGSVYLFRASGSEGRIELQQ